MPSLAPARALTVLEDRRGPVLGLTSRRPQPAQSGAGVTKSVDRWERAVEEEKEKPKDKGSESSVDGRKDDDARAQGGPVTAPQPGIVSAPIVQCESKRLQPRASQQGPPLDVTSGSTASVDVTTFMSHGDGRRGRGRGGGGNRGGAPTYGFVRWARYVHRSCAIKIRP